MQLNPIMRWLLQTHICALFSSLVIARGSGDGDASAFTAGTAGAAPSAHLQMVLGQLGGLLLQLVAHQLLSARAPPMALHDLGSPPETSADTYLEPTDPAVRTSWSSPSCSGAGLGLALGWSDATAPAAAFSSVVRCSSALSMRSCSSFSFASSASARAASASSRSLLAAATRAAASSSTLVIGRSSASSGPAAPTTSAPARGEGVGKSPSHLQMVLGQLGGVLTQPTEHHLSSASVPLSDTHDTGSAPAPSADASKAVYAEAHARPASRPSFLMPMKTTNR